MDMMLYALNMYRIGSKRLKELQGKEFQIRQLMAANMKLIYQHKDRTYN